MRQKEHQIWQAILAVLPKAGETVVDWDALSRTAFGDLFAAMEKTKQNPIYHGEGDVLCHTKLVCEAMLQEAEYQAATAEEQQAWFLSALLHDLGKTRTTRLEDGVLVSPYHARTGVRMAREFLWRTCGLAGTPQAVALRETVCAMVRYHSFPPFATEAKNGEQKLLSIAENGMIAPMFSIKALCLLERADVLGRISADARDYLDRIECCRLLAEELGCLDAPYPFADAHSRRAYFRGQLTHPSQSLYNDTWGEVLMMAGLPGTGKDTYLQTHYPTLPMISLDEIRAEIGAPSTGAQGEVIAIAEERAKRYLRSHTPFVWNATNIQADLRRKLVGLMEQYGASVRILFLETDWTEELRRNEDRRAVVPREAIVRMLAKLEPPEPHEAHILEWKCV